jgi:hypothetical protein
MKAGEDLSLFTHKQHSLLRQLFVFGSQFFRNGRSHAAIVPKKVYRPTGAVCRVAETYCAGHRERKIIIYPERAPGR